MPPNTRGLNLLHIPELILHGKAIATRTGPAPCHDPITSMAPDSKSSVCCRHLCLLHNGCQVISLLQPCRLEELVRISQDVPLCSDKPQEALFKRLLGQTLQVPNLGGLCDGQTVPFSTRQSYVDLQHQSNNQKRHFISHILLFYRNLEPKSHEHGLSPRLLILTSF